MASFHSSVIVTLAGNDTRAADTLTFAFPARPQAMTMYLRFVELGTIVNSSVAILAIPGGGTAPRLEIGPVSGNYRITYHTASATAVSTLSAAPVYGDTVELLGTLSASGSVQISQSINGAAVTTASPSAALVLPASWLTPTLNLAAGGPFIGYRNIKILRGVFDMPTMRRKAGVTL